MKQNTKDNIYAGALIAWLVGFIAFLACCVSGCANTPSGVKVVASSASYTNVGDVNWDEYKIPVLSLYLGPKATVWVNKNYHALESIEICGTVTNVTEALAIYESEEQKALSVKLTFRDGTNVVSEATK